MTQQDYAVQSSPSTNPTSEEIAESDEEYLIRQFHISIAALERVHALAPGEFTELINTPVHSHDERQQRTKHHETIARRALQAAQQGLLAEEEFNIWSGRRKENGSPVKIRFEEAYERACTPSISRQRGALTGIVRSYVRLQDALIAELIAQGEATRSAEELLEIERSAVRLGFLLFEIYQKGDVNGWPCFPRSTGRFRGATRLRQFFEERQAALPLPATNRDALLHEAGTLGYSTTTPGHSVVQETEASYTSKAQKPAPLTGLITRLSNLFR